MTNQLSPPLKIARRYTNLVVHSLSKAVGAVRNYGAKSAKGKYLLFVDADTILPQGYLQKAYKVFASNKDLSAFCGWFRFKEREPKLLFSEVVANFYFVIKDKIGQPTLPGCCGIAIRKEIFEEVAENEKQLRGKELSAETFWDKSKQDAVMDHWHDAMLEKLVELSKN